MIPPPESPDSPKGKTAHAASIRRMDEEMLLRDFTAQTRETCMGRVRRFLRWAAEQVETLPQVLSRGEVVALLIRVDSPRYRAILMLIYSAGLRISEGHEQWNHGTGQEYLQP